jgi:hypothetical protein
VHITNVYEKTVIVNQTDVRVSFNGGSGGITAKPTPEQEAAAHEKHVAADQAQLQHERTASADKSLLASENHGHPAIAATAKPGEFSGPGVVAAREAKPETPLEAKPAGAEPGHPNPEMTKLPEGKPVENGLQQKEHELPRGEATINGATPPKPGEAKPLTTETRPLNTEAKPVEREVKPIENGGRALESKPLEAKPENHEAKLPPEEPKPQLAPPPRPAAPPPPHVAGPAPHPAPQVVHPPGKPEPQDKKPPG